MVKNSVQQVSDFFWQSQFKFYFNDSYLEAKMANSTLQYGNEFSNLYIFKA